MQLLPFLGSVYFSNVHTGTRKKYAEIRTIRSVEQNMIGNFELTETDFECYYSDILNANVIVCMKYTSLYCYTTFLVL